MTITIGTQKNLPGAHYIGRNGDSALGNPFAAAGNTVDNVVQGYRVYLNLVVEKGELPGEAARMVQRLHPELKLSISYGWKIPSAAEMVKELQGLKAQLKRGEPVALACHCYSKQPEAWTGRYQFRCHAEPIAGWLVWHLAQDKLPIA
jgi:hypothetical protein